MYSAYLCNEFKLNSAWAFPRRRPLPLRLLLKGYGAFVYTFADIEQLAAADVFVGTFTSNVGRLVAMLREGLGKPRESSISLDASWQPVRSRA